MSKPINDVNFRRVSRTLSCGLVLMAAHLAMPVAFGMDLNTVSAPSMSGFGIQSTDPSIGVGETVNGALGDGDELATGSGEPLDFYVITSQDASSGYTITASSTEFPVVSRLYVMDETQEGTWYPLQEAALFTPEVTQAQYSGAFPKAGQYAVSISSANQEYPNGSYSVTLTGTSGATPAVSPQAGMSQSTIDSFSLQGLGN